MNTKWQKYKHLNKLLIFFYKKGIQMKEYVLSVVIWPPFLLFSQVKLGFGKNILPKRWTNVLTTCLTKNLLTQDWLLTILDNNDKLLSSRNTSKYTLRSKNLGNIVTRWECVFLNKWYVEEIHTFVMNMTYFMKGTYIYYEWWSQEWNKYFLKCFSSCGIVVF